MIDTIPVSMQMKWTCVLDTLDKKKRTKSELPNFLKLNGWIINNCRNSSGKKKIIFFLISSVWYRRAFLLAYLEFIFYHTISNSHHCPPCRCCWTPIWYHHSETKISKYKYNMRKSEKELEIFFLQLI